MSRNKILNSFLACCLFLFFTLGGCAPQEPGASVGEPATTKVQVVTTIFPWAAILQSLGGALVEVTVLLPAGSSPHTYEPTIEQAKAVSRADLLVYTGGGLDDWILKLAAAAAGENTVVEVLQLLQDSPIPDDPHVWTDPLLVQEEIAPALAEMLIAIRPAHAGQFQQNLKAFQEELQLLHTDLAGAMQDFAGQRFICYHSSWNYFASRYGLGRPVHIEEFPGQEPTAKWLASLVETARAEGIKNIFAEPQLSSKAATVIAAELGGQVLVLDPLGGEGLPGRDSYNALMRYNLEVFREGLQ